MKLKNIILLLILFVGKNALSQSNSTEIWYFDINQSEGKFAIGTPIRITENDFYDNQPSFSRDGNKIWFASMPDTIQSDIYSYDIRKKETKQLTYTQESEYQPSPIPFYKDKLSIVRVDLDRGQRFYEIGFDGTNPSLLMPNEDSVAYYCWINDTTVATYMLNGSAGSLHQFDMIPQQSVIIMSNGGFGRCLSKIPFTNDITFVSKPAEGKYQLTRFDFINQDRWPITEFPDGVEDYCWGLDKKIYIGDKGKLWMYDASQETSEWKEIADFTKTIGNFYRIVMSPLGNRIAVVSYKGARP